MLRRALLSLLAGLALAPLPASAQNMGVLYFKNATTNQLHKINGDGTGQALVTADAAIRNFPSSRADYPGGRQFLWRRTAGTIPGTSTAYDDLMVWNLAGETKQVTAFTGPLYFNGYQPLAWSNDGQDSFFSFFADDPATGKALLYRAHVTPLDIADPAFQPLVPGDPRLEVVAAWPSRFSYAWDRTGSCIFYLDTRVADSTRLRFKTIGEGATPDEDPIVFEQAGPAGIRPLGVAVSPATDQAVLKAQVYELQKRSWVFKTDGLYSREPVTRAWAWLITNQSSGLKGFSATPCFSPDGTGIGFSCGRTVASGKTTTTVYGIYKMPADGSGLFRLTESSVDSGTHLKWTW